MRNVLIFSVVALLAAASVGCTCRNPCGGTSGSGWYPGYYLFGHRAQTPTPAACCDPCGAPGMMATPVVTAAPCCQ
ncbi:MAG TPA: hypothetical protein VHV08_01075 [Pirellulales bacterium]|nr:hypothetical protein [Pirellulales bacterium]